MGTLPEKLKKKIEERQKTYALRELSISNLPIDFSSNDYLGFANSEKIYNQAYCILKEKGIQNNGATGSRLLSGNHALYLETENMLAAYHAAPAALIFNSGYDANIGFFSSVPQRGDLIFYDELIHASIRDGIQMSYAKSYKFDHNDISHLSKKLEQVKQQSKVEEIYVVTESIFSMDGDTPDLDRLVRFCDKNNCHLVVDEAHAIGVFGEQGVGLLQHLGLENHVFARINTFGKAMGCHGAAILGSKELKQYLINFARSFIYTTALPPHALATIQSAYQNLQDTVAIKKLRENISFFNDTLKTLGLASTYISSNSAIHCCIITGNQKVKAAAKIIQEKGFDVKPILSPTVPKGQERLRICLHSFNSKQEIGEMLQLLATFAND